MHLPEDVWKPAAICEYQLALKDLAILDSTAEKYTDRYRECLENIDRRTKDHNAEMAALELIEVMENREDESHESKDQMLATKGDPSEDYQILLSACIIL